MVKLNTIGTNYKETKTVSSVRETIRPIRKQTRKLFKIICKNDDLCSRDWLFSFPFFPVVFKNNVVLCNTQKITVKKRLVKRCYHLPCSITVLHLYQPFIRFLLVGRSNNVMMVINPLTNVILLSRDAAPPAAQRGHLFL